MKTKEKEKAAIPGLSGCFIKFNNYSGDHIYMVVIIINHKVVYTNIMHLILGVYIEEGERKKK